MKLDVQAYVHETRRQKIDNDNDYILKQQKTHNEDASGTGRHRLENKTSSKTLFGIYQENDNDYIFTVTNHHLKGHRLKHLCLCYASATSRSYQRTRIITKTVRKCQEVCAILHKLFLSVIFSTFCVAI